MNPAGDLREAVRSLLEDNLGLRRGERLLLLGDHGEDVPEVDLAADVSGILADLHPETTALIYPSTGRSGIEPPKEAWEAAFGPEAVSRFEEGGLLDRLIGKRADGDDLARAEEIAAVSDAVDAVVALAYHSTSHTLFRRLLTVSSGVRYASMPHFHRDMFFGSMRVNWHELALSTRTLARAMEGVDHFEIGSGNGTSLTLSATGRHLKTDDGILTEPGAWGNLPAGEVFLAPLEGTAEGILVLEWGPSAKLSSPLTVEIRAGRAVSVSGENGDTVRWLEGLLAAHPENRNVAELGIGTNPRATRPDSILESEKILGTVHVAFGDNHNFGGKVVAPFHLDFVVYGATLVAVWESGGGRRVILSEGDPGW
ncbi:MAG: aminopeptidase [bacterium]|nr:MAG: aminopeptidase [bacterium]